MFVSVLNEHQGQWCVPKCNEHAIALFYITCTCLYIYIFFFPPGERILRSMRLDLTSVFCWKPNDRSTTHP